MFTCSCHYCQNIAQPDSPENRGAQSKKSCAQCENCNAGSVSGDQVHLVLENPVYQSQNRGIRSNFEIDDLPPV